MSAGAAVFVMGPAGSGKSTFCASLIQHIESAGRRTAHLINLDPAAEDLEVPPSKDIRDLITVDEVMDELMLGPNGGLIFSLEHLLENISWLTDDLGQYTDEFLVVDCPGQIELYTHSHIMQRIVSVFQEANYHVCGLYLLESLFLQDVTKYFAGVLTATSCMLQLGIPHINVLSKVDLLQEVSAEDSDDEDSTSPLARFFDPDPCLLLERLTKGTPARFKDLNVALVQLLDTMGMVRFVPLDIRRESSMERLMLHIEAATQYEENLEPREPEDAVDYDADEE